MKNVMDKSTLAIIFDLFWTISKLVILAIVKLASTGTSDPNVETIPAKNGSKPVVVN